MSKQQVKSTQRSDFGTPGDRHSNHDAPASAMAWTVRLLGFAKESASVEAYLRAALPETAELLKAEDVSLVSAEKGAWRTVGTFGRTADMPREGAADALDRGQPVSTGGWTFIPVRTVSARQEVLAVRSPAAEPAAHSPALLRDVAQSLAAALAIVEARQAELRRSARHEALSTAAATWYQTRETEPLLEKMAETATRILDADRASIFLWDRQSHTLVARPALGVDGQELRVPDDAGIVGQVIHTGLPSRLRHNEESKLVNREVDQRLGYHTRTLLCVPMRLPSGELIGAFEAINKRSGDFDDDDQAALTELASHAAVALSSTREREQLLATRRQLVDEAAAGTCLVGNSPAIEALRSIVGRIAPTDLAVLVLGENGTGKEVVSRLIHYDSPRRNQPFIAVNCAALSDTLLESELFGHEKGAFTDAHEARQGKFELAAGGTLFLDEIAELSPGGQAKLLRVLEEKVVVRVGGSRPIATDTRVIAATNQDLAAMVRERRFRQDLYFRLNVVTLELPPLRERIEDVVPLAEHFLRQFARDARRNVPRLTSAARRRLEGHDWPGNVRELRNLMERLVYLAAGEAIDAHDLAFIVSPEMEVPTSIAADLELAEATDQFQTTYIEQAITRAGGNMTAAADALGLHRSNLYRKMRQLGMMKQG